MRYNVTLPVAGTVTMQIEADSPELATSGAIALFNKVTDGDTDAVDSMSLCAGEVSATANAEDDLSEASLYTASVLEA